jgi:hypothetical protein
MRSDVVITPTTHFGNDDGYSYFKATIPYKVNEELVRVNPGFTTDSLNTNTSFIAEIEFKMKNMEYSLEKDEAIGKSFYKFKDLELKVNSYKSSAVKTQEKAQDIVPETSESQTKDEPANDNSTSEDAKVIEEKDKNETKTEESIIIEEQQPIDKETDMPEINSAPPETEIPVELNQEPLNAQ